MKIERAVGHPQQKGGDRQAEVAHTVDEERLLGRPGRLRLAVPESDQEIAAGPHRLPEHIHEQKVAGGHKHRHRKNEHRYQGEEPRIARIVVQVADGVNRHEQANAGDDHQECRGEGIEPQGYRDRKALLSHARHTLSGGRALHGGPLPERGDHVDRTHRFAVGTPAAHLGGGGEQQDQGHHRSSGDAGHGGQMGAGPQSPAEEDGADGPHQREQGNENQKRGGKEWLHG